MARLGIIAVAFVSLSAASAADDQTSKIPLTVPSGVPLRVYLTGRISKRTRVPVEAKLLDPVYAFDREVVPAGTQVLGQVSRTVPVSKWQRARAILAGDFTPLRSAQVEFNTLLMPDGRKIALRTVETAGLNSIYVPPGPPKKPKKPKKQQAQAQNPTTQNPTTQNPNGGVLGTARQTARQTIQDQINQRINGQTRGIAGIVRGPNKKEKLEDFLIAKLPYRPQWVRRGTRFDAELRDPLQFGSEEQRNDAFPLLGSQPNPDSVVHARLLTPLDSGSSKLGEPVEAVIAEPLFSPDHKLILPEGTCLTGAVVLVKKARWFHRGGQLRYNFQRMDLPEEAALLKPVPVAPPELRTQATLQDAENGGKTTIKVDTEGGVKATESKTRLLAPLIAVMIANKSMDNDAGRNHAATGGDANVGGRTLGGGLGFGMLGSALAQSSRYVGTAFGIYGMAWSVYSNVFARGGEVEFGRNAMVDIKFGARKPDAASKFQPNAVGGGAN